MADFKDLTTPNIIEHNGDPDNKGVKKNLLVVNKILRLTASPNKARAIENSVIGTVANSLVHTISKLAALEGFNDEMEKMSHTMEQVWSKIKPFDRLRLSIVRPGIKNELSSLLSKGRQISATNAVNSALGRPLVRGVQNRPVNWDADLIQRNTYTKPGQF